MERCSGNEPETSSQSFDEWFDAWIETALDDLED